MMMSTWQQDVVVGLINSLKSRQVSVRRQAVRALAQQQLEESVALRQFTKLLEDRDAEVRLLAVQALESLGAAAVPALIPVVHDADSQVRWEAATVLGRIGPAAADAVPALIQVLQGGDARLRQAAIGALGAIGSKVELAIPALIPFLQDTNLLVTRIVAAALVRMGEPAVAPLIAAFEAGDLAVRCDIAWALIQLGPEARAAVPALTAGLRARVLRAAVEVQRPLERTAGLHPTQPVFIKPRRGTEEALLTIVIQALGAIGPDARAAVPELTQLMHDGYGTIQVTVAAALKKINAAEGALPPVAPPPFAKGGHGGG